MKTVNSLSGGRTANAMLDIEKSKKQIEKNRDEINKLLNGDYPLDIVVCWRLNPVILN